MAVEYLQYISAGERDEIVIQLTGGGVAATFIKGISSANVAYILRDLADRLEQGVNERSASEPGAE
jgi:hypothetical protein